VLLAYALAIYSAAMASAPTEDSDEPGYMDEACWIAEHGGVPGFARACVKGEYPFYQRHPLVNVIASPWAGRSLDRLRPARAAKAAASVAALAMIMAGVWRMAGPAAGVGLAALVAVSNNWFAKGPILTAEPVVYGPFFLMWAFMAGKLKPRGRWFWAGAMWGLAYMTKGTALAALAALPVAWAAWALVRRRSADAAPLRKSWRPLAIAAAGFVAGAVVCAWPLLARNAVRFGNPLSNLASDVMWLDSWAEHVPLYEDPDAPRPTPWSYLRTHSAAQIARRAVFGLRMQTPRLLGGVASDPAFGRPVWAATLALSAALVVLGLAAAARERASWAGVFTLCLTGVGFALFVWYAYISYASRFVATFAPILAACAVADRPKLARLPRIPQAWRTRAAAAAACAAVALMALHTRWDHVGLPRGPVPTTPEFRFLLDWHRDKVVAERAVCFQTPYLAPRFAMEWLLDPKDMIFQVPLLDSFDRLQRYMDARRAKYLVVERDSLRERLELLSEYFEITPDNALRVKAVPPGWAVATIDPYLPLDFVILERLRR